MNQPDLAASFGGTSELIFWSFRYFLGRSTGATVKFAESLAVTWHKLEQKDKDMIRRELEHEFERDDNGRRLLFARLAAAKTYEERDDAHLETNLFLGSNCDRAAWEKVRAAYQKERP